MSVLQDLMVGEQYWSVICGILYVGVQHLHEGRGWSDWLLYVGSVRPSVGWTIGLWFVGYYMLGCNTCVRGVVGQIGYYMSVL